MCGKAWRSHWLMTQLTNGQYDCVLVFMSMVDILNITCNCPFVFAVLDAVGNILRVMKCNTSFSQRSKSTLFRWGEHVICVCVKCSSCMCKNYKNQMSFSRVMITNVLQRFLWNTVYTRMWANAQRDGRPAKYRWRPLFNAAVSLTPTTRVPCYAAKTRNPLKLAGVPKNNEMISAASRPRIL